jgi:hypothetical protein
MPNLVELVHSIVMFKKWNYPIHQMLQNAEVDGVEYIITVESGKDQEQSINQ